MNLPVIFTLLQHIKSFRPICGDELQYTLRIQSIFRVDAKELQREQHPLE